MRRNIALLFLLLVLTGCSRQRQLTTGKVSVTVAHWGHEKILIYLPFYIAIDAGLFEQQGLIVKTKYSGNDDQVFATVISGEAQFGVGDPTFTAISRERGGPGKVVATLVGAVANWGVTNKKDLEPIHDPRALNGLRVTSFPAPSTTFTILSEIKSTLNLRRMRIVQLAFGTEIGALERGDADLAIMLEPQTSFAVSKGYREVWSLADYYGPFTLTGLTTSDDEIAKRPEVVQEMVNGLQQALVYIHNHPTETAEIASRNLPTLDKTVVRNAIDRMVRDKTIPTDALVSPDGWRKTLEIRYKAGDLKSIEGGLAAVDNSFAQKALQGAQVGQDATRRSALNVTTVRTPRSPGLEGTGSASLPDPASDGSARAWLLVGRAADIAGLITFVVALGALVWAILEFYSRYRPFPQEDVPFRQAVAWLVEQATAGKRHLPSGEVSQGLMVRVNGWGASDVKSFLDALRRRGIVGWDRKRNVFRLLRSIRSLQSGETRVEELSRNLKTRHA